MNDTSIVAVQFQNRKSPDKFDGREYSYYSKVPLEVGDVIIAPAKNGGTIVRVCRVGVKDSEIAEHVKPHMRVIEKLIRPDIKEGHGSEK